MSGNGLSIAPNGEQTPKYEQSGAAKLLEKGGFQASPEELQNIESAIAKSRELADAMKKDASAVEANLTEKSRFESLYIKGLGQVVQLKDGTKMSFTEIVKLPEKEKNEVLDGLKRSERSAFHDYELQAANQRIEGKKEALNQANQRIEGKKEALNQNNEKLQGFGRKAKDLMDESGRQFVSTELQRVQSSPAASPITQRLIEQGATIEDIQSGKYNGTLEAYIITQNEKTLAPKDPDKAREFTQVVNQMRDTLGVPPTPANIDRFAESKVLGEDRSKIVGTMHDIGSSGNYDRMRWDPETRQVIFESKYGNSRVIDTTRTPPQESIMKQGLSISRPLTEISRDEQKLIDIRSSIFSERVERSKLQISRIPISDPVREEQQSRLYEEAQGGGTPPPTLEKRLEAINALKNTNSERKNDHLKAILDGQSSEPLNSQLERELEGLTTLERSYKKELELERSKPNTLKNTASEKFDQDAQDTLTRLIDKNFHYLGQDRLEQLIDGLYTRDGQKGLWEGGLDMTSRQRREQQIQELQDTIDKIGRKVSLEDPKNPISSKGVPRTLNNWLKDERFSTTWKTPAQLGNWLNTLPESGTTSPTDSPPPTT